MNELKEIEDNIENLIYTIRGKQVMLDSDLARLYQCTEGTKYLKRTVKRNIARFPNDFMFILTKEEADCLRCQIDTSKFSIRGGNRYEVYAFTEGGISMLASVLHTDVAIDMSIKIIRMFVELRHNQINCNICNDRFLGLENRIDKVEVSINKVLEYMDKNKEKTNLLFYDGMTYDALSFLTNLIECANSKIIVIDNYADYKLLDILKYKKREVKAIIYSNHSSKINKTLLDSFNSEYSNLELVSTNEFHDRYLIIDDELYLLGSSINSIGNRLSSVIKMEDETYNKTIKDILNNIK